MTKCDAYSTTTTMMKRSATGYWNSTLVAGTTYYGGVPGAGYWKAHYNVGSTSKNIGTGLTAGTSTYGECYSSITRSRTLREASGTVSGGSVYSSSNSSTASSSAEKTGTAREAVNAAEIVTGNTRSKASECYTASSSDSNSYSGRSMV